MPTSCRPVEPPPLWRACRRRGGGWLLWAALTAAPMALAAQGASTAAPAGLKLHVPSPDWRDQIIYFVLTDRFADGDPSNNDQGAGEYDPSQRSRYSGGDLKGLTGRLGYIRGLGATAVWVTPPVANQWRDPLADYTGYHGYWAENFKQVDKHLGLMSDYQRLSHELHSRGMYLVQDIVLNHTANFFGYRGGWDAADPARHYVPNAAPLPVARPSQPPFDQNDPRDPAQRAAAIYHWTPDVTDYTDKNQELNYQMSGLDDLNTENPVVRRALRDSYAYWIRHAGVDAFRIDTAFYVPPELFKDFLHADDKQAPGIDEVARQTGRTQFHVFGEGFGIDRPYGDEQARKIESYMTGAGGEPLLPGMLNFPLYGALGDIFARGRPTAELGHRIAATMKLHARPHLMANFIDNHDIDRFLAGGSEAGLRQSLLAMMTLPGIPVIYYGTEQAFTQPRAAMFAAGYGSGGRDHFDTSAPLYRYIAELSALRTSHKLFSRGTPTVLKDNPALPGALAWRMAHEGQAAIVVFNSADRETLLDNLDTGLPAGTRLQGLFGIHGMPADLMAGAQGRITMRLAPRSGAVWKVADGGGPPAVSATNPATNPAENPAATPTAALTLEPLPTAAVSGDFTVRGQARGVGSLALVVDGDLQGARRVVPDADGRWSAVVDTSRMMDPAVRHSLVAWTDGDGRGEGGVASDTRSFQVQRAWVVLADQDDPAGDDAGPRGRYVYPTDRTYAPRQMDLRRVRVSGAGGALRLELTMGELTTTWNPANGFDHVAFTFFIEVPGREGGASVMPLQNGSLPAGMRWHYRLRAHGWSNALFSAEGASATHEGTPTAPAATISVDRDARRVSFVLPAAALGGLPSLAGVKVYVSTWDYDGGYRALAASAAPYSVGGGDPASDPKVMDDSAVILLP